MKNKLMIFLSLFSCGVMQTADIFRAIALKDKVTIQKWLKSGSDIDQLNEQGQTILVKAVQSGNKDLVYRLLKLGVQVNIVDTFGRTALDYAVETGNKNIAKMLVKVQAQVTTESNVARCQMMIAKKTCSWARVIIGITVGVLGLAVVVCSGTGLIMACAMMAGMGGSGTPLLVGGITVLAMATGVTYGAVKIGKSGEECHHNNVAIVRAVA